MSLEWPLWGHCGGPCGYRPVLAGRDTSSGDFQETQCVMTLKQPQEYVSSLHELVFSQPQGFGSVSMNSAEGEGPLEHPGKAPGGSRSGPCELGVLSKITSWQEELRSALVPGGCPCPLCGPGMAEAPCEEGGDSASVMELLQQRAEGRTNFSLRCTKDRRVTTGVTVLAVVLLLTVTIIVLAAKKHPPCTTTALPGCLESGIGFGDKCFYFLEEEVDWEGSQHSCLSHQAHLATIDTREELHFLLRYGNFMEYWVGLRREGSGPWKWLNGSLFNALFDIHGNGHCAYTNSHRISSDRCSETKFSICSHLQRHSSKVQKDPEILNST